MLNNTIFNICFLILQTLSKKALKRLSTPLSEEQQYLCCGLFHILVWNCPSPLRAQSADRAPRPPCLHHYQLSLNSSDHHLNYPSSCPPDGFFANSNFSVDGQRVMTAGSVLCLCWNTEKVYGCRYGCKILLHHIRHTLRRTQPCR